MSQIAEPMTAAALSRPTWVRYGVLAWVCSLSMITYIDRVCIKQVGEDIRESLGLTPVELGWVFTAFALSYSLLEVPSGWWGDRIGPRKVLARIVVCWSVFTALTGAAWSLWSLLAFRFLFGAGEAGAYPNIARALRNWFPYRRRGQAQGLLWMSGRWGGAFAPILIGTLSLWVGWRGAFVVFGVVGIVWVVFFYAWFRDTPREHASANEAECLLIEEGAAGTRPAPISWRGVLGSPSLWLLCTMYYCSNAGWSFFITWDVVYYKKVLQLSDWSLSIASGAPLFFGGIACMLGGLFTDRQVRYWGRRWGRTLQGAAAYASGGLLFLLALFLTESPWLAVAVLCLASFFKDSAMAVSWSTCIDIGHRYSGTVAGFMNMVGNLGTVVSPPLVAYIAQLIEDPQQSEESLLAPLVEMLRDAGVAPWQFALVYSSALFLIASVCWFFINPRRVIVYSKDDQERLRGEGVLT